MDGCGHTSAARPIARAFILYHHGRPSVRVNNLLVNYLCVHRRMQRGHDIGQSFYKHLFLKKVYMRHRSRGKLETPSLAGVAI